MTRESGVLMHITSLPSPYGIGTFGKAAYNFVDFLQQSGQSYWQILPLTTTSYGDSPYQSFSAFAGNTQLIDFDLLTEAGLLTQEDYQDLNFGSDERYVDYGTIFYERRKVLEKAVTKFNPEEALTEFKAFIETNDYWLDPFSLYMAIKEDNGLVPWNEWPEPLAKRDPEAIEQQREKLKDAIHYHKVTQYFFYIQYMNLKTYANQRNIRIIGDIPIYVAQDSVEMWQTPELFKMRDELQPEFVAGTPPDSFSDEGQFWGNPIYDWDAMEANDFEWWVLRLRYNFELYDVVRIDHFRGFESFWQVPYGMKSSAEGHWAQGPSIKLFDRVKQQLGDVHIIAEDLGFMTDEVIAMRDHTGYPGMKILQFGFNGYEDSVELPHNYIPNCIAYVGTHDNMTARGWYETASQASRDQMDYYLKRQPGESPAHAMNRAIAGSVANIVIYTMQDLLNLGNEARMNEPSTIGHNWQWRMTEDQLIPQVSNVLQDLNRTYFRNTALQNTIDSKN